MRRPRWANRLWAAWHGYFWLPCPRCGRMFGGHEHWRFDGYGVWVGHLAEQLVRTRVTCWECPPVGWYAMEDPRA